MQKLWWRSASGRRSGRLRYRWRAACAIGGGSPALLVEGRLSEATEPACARLAAIALHLWQMARALRRSAPPLLSRLFFVHAGAMYRAPTAARAIQRSAPPSPRLFFVNAGAIYRAPTAARALRRGAPPPAAPFCLCGRDSSRLCGRGCGAGRAAAGRAAAGRAAAGAKKKGASFRMPPEGWR